MVGLYESNSQESERREPDENRKDCNKYDVRKTTFRKKRQQTIHYISSQVSTRKAQQ